MRERLCGNSSVGMVLLPNSFVVREPDFACDRFDPKASQMHRSNAFRHACHFLRGLHNHEVVPSLINSVGLCHCDSWANGDFFGNQAGDTCVDASTPEACFLLSADGGWLASDETTFALRKLYSQNDRINFLS